MKTVVTCPLIYLKIVAHGRLSIRTLERKGTEIMFKTLINGLFHAGRSPKVATGGKRAKSARVRVVDLSTLKVSAPLTKKEIAAKYKAGHVAEMSDVHASV